MRPDPVRSPRPAAVVKEGPARKKEAGKGPSMGKVARVTLVFWIMKICATTLGESAWEHSADASALGFGLRALLLAGAFALVLAWQMRADRFRALRYWTVVLAVGAVAAMVSDAVALGPWPGAVGATLLLACALVATLALWHRTTGNVAVDAIVEPRIEAFYWLAIVLANTLGTALAEALAGQHGLSLGGEMLLVGGLVAIVVLAAYFTRFDLAVLFWIAIVFTRPFGATFGDFLASPGEAGGLDLGTSGTVGVLGVLLLAFFMYARADDLRARRWG